MATTADPRPSAGSGLSLHAALSALAGFVLVLIWGLTGAGYFWPAWALLGLSIPVAIHAAARVAWMRPPGRDRGAILRGGLGATVAATMLIVWLLSGAHGFWPGWPLLGIGVVLGIDALISYADRLPVLRGRRALVDRVDVLTRTREGALNVQAAELRRIERDLHDGAQARLVALSMLLGRAEERLDDRPEAAELIRRARDEAAAANAELRDLARGIAPPVLADRGLEAAIEALGQRAAIDVTVETSLVRRPLPVVETAAYFVVSEALTNVAKHGGPGTSARVRVVEEVGRIVIEVSDDGAGGADAAGSGLTGLRHRVEALDGALHVTSPTGSGTLVRAELPCAS